MQNRFLEVVFGFLVLLTMGLFLLYGFFTIIKGGFSTYTIKATFNNIGSLVEGSKVNINGVKIGKVTSISLNESSYEVIVTLEITNDIKIPKDSKLFINTVGFFDAPDIVISPSKSQLYAKNGDILTNTQDWVSLEDKIGGIFFNSKG